MERTPTHATLSSPFRVNVTTDQLHHRNSFANTPWAAQGRAGAITNAFSLFAPAGANREKELELARHGKEPNMLRRREPAAAAVLIPAAMLLLLAAATAMAAAEEALPIPMEVYFSAAELARIAGYGEEPVSSVSVSGGSLPASSASALAPTSSPWTCQVCRGYSQLPPCSIIP